MAGMGEAATRSTGPESLVRRGMETLFEDQKFSGDLMAKLYRLGMSEQEMDAIFKRAENDILNYVYGLQDDSSAAQAQEALTLFVKRLKRSILKNPVLFADRP